MAKELNYETYSDGVSSGVVLVDFWASWCGPCKMLAPTIDELEADYADRICVCKLNVDDCPNIATNLGIYSIPTVLVYKDGELKERVVGYHLKREYAALIDKYID